MLTFRYLNKLISTYIFIYSSQIETEDNSNLQSAINSTNYTQESTNNISSASIFPQHNNTIQTNQINSVSSSLNNVPPAISRVSEDILDHFESDDDFEQNIDYGMLDELENSQRQVNAVSGV